VVKILFDTNVLVGALVPQHPTHQVCAGWLRQALIAQAALKAEVDRILTFNIKDFCRLGNEVSRLVQVPE
jgi:hypothetical protein